MRRIVLTGGPYSGKTTLVERLRALGHRVVPEAALRVIEELSAELGTERQIAWRRSNVTQFQARVARMQLELEVEAEADAPELVFYDRGMPDGVAFCRAQQADLPRELLDVSCRYDAVLLLDTLQPYDTRAASGRVGDYRFSLRIRDELRSVYAELGRTPLALAGGSVATRLSRVIEVATAAR